MLHVHRVPPPLIHSFDPCPGRMQVTADAREVAKNCSCEQQVGVMWLRLQHWIVHSQESWGLDVCVCWTGRALLRVIFLSSLLAR